MRWFHWTLDQYMAVYNPPNAAPIVLERVTSDYESRPGGPAAAVHTKALYRLTEGGRGVLQGVSEEMCSTSWRARGLARPAAGVAAAAAREPHALLEVQEGERGRAGGAPTGGGPFV
jgi:hypothetical protein